MITFIGGLLLGLTLGWLRLRVVARELVATTRQRETLSTALKQASELLKNLTTTLEKAGAKDNAGRGIHLNPGAFIDQSLLN
jgi:hypothetical protein